MPLSILAVMPCNVDIATQEILKLAESADPEGARTMGVLTKPDLATETVTRDAVMDLVLGRRRSLKLGYYLVKNRSADDRSSTFEERAEAEKAFFMGPPWSTARDRCGTAALKGRLRQLLSKISNQELPHVKAEVSQRLKACKAELESMGPARADESSQRLYLGRIAMRFRTIAQAALNGHYTEDKIFMEMSDFKLISRVIMLCERFSDIFHTFAHQHEFQGSRESLFTTDNVDNYTRISYSTYPELQEIVQHEGFVCPRPTPDTIMPLIRTTFHFSRGPELGTVSSPRFLVVDE
jgi:hypothetical protein